jgi:hypothetical protein
VNRFVTRRTLMLNPYEPSHTAIEPRTARDCKRDQCPYCLHHQNIWNAINSIRMYRCQKCTEPLVVALPRVWSRLHTAAVLVIAAACFLLPYMQGSRIPVYFSVLPLAFIASGFALRFAVGYFHPAVYGWAHLTRKLSSAPSNCPQRERVTMR